jgi:hypothetical protein
MTQEEKRALIAVKLGGYAWVQYRKPGDSRYATRKLLPAGADQNIFVPADMSAPIDPLNDGPHYDEDLNLCARVEAKIADRGCHDKRYYQSKLANAMWKINPSNGGEAFEMITAPAPARVDAMVALIQELGL